jgi:hypothetical protein
LKRSSKAWKNLSRTPSWAGKRSTNDLWPWIGGKSFDGTDVFAAYLHALRWSAVTANGPTVPQASRSGQASRLMSIHRLAPTECRAYSLAE